MLKRISVLTVVLVVMLSVFSLTAFANEPVETVMMPVLDDVAEDAVEDAIADMPEVKAEKKMQFEPMAFVENLNIMGVGMLGIFIVIGAIILSVFVLNKLTSPKPSNKD